MTDIYFSYRIEAGRLIITPRADRYAGNEQAIFSLGVLDRYDYQAVCFEMNQIDHIDSHILRMLLSVHQHTRIASIKTPCYIQHCTAKAEELLRIMRVDKLYQLAA